VLALLVLLALATPVALAARPDSGSRDIQDVAQASFEARLDECLFVHTTVRYFAGDNLQGPIGSGKPGSWSDVPVNVAVFDSCSNDSPVVRLDGLGFPSPGPNFERLDQAVLDVPTMLICEDWTDAAPCDGSTPNIAVELHLTWVGNGDTAISIGHDLGGRTFRQERFETAVVSGTVEFADSAWWSDLTLTGENSHSATIGHANEISLP
jgi:hypothetical protein